MHIMVGAKTTFEIFYIIKNQDLFRKKDDIYFFITKNSYFLI